MFIVFEGHDGTGKTTQVELLADALRKEGRDVITIRAPGGTLIGEQIRTLMLSDFGAETASLKTRLLLSHAARQQAWDVIIQPALDAGKIVIADRWLWSGYLYQVIGEGNSYHLWNNTNSLIEYPTTGFKVDLTVVLTVDEKVRSKRKAKDNAKVSKDDIHVTESFGTAFEERVSAAIDLQHNLKHFTKDIMVVAQENCPVDKVHEKIINHEVLTTLLKEYDHNDAK